MKQLITNIVKGNRTVTQSQVKKEIKKLVNYMVDLEQVLSECDRALAILERTELNIKKGEIKNVRK